MSELQQRAVSGPIQEKVLITHADWIGFVRYSKGREDLEVFNTLNEFYRLSEEIVLKAGGVMLKSMGDSVMAIYDEKNANAGILSMKELKEQTEAWFQKKSIDCKLSICAHFGEAIVGPMNGRVDAIGQSVNICMTLPKGDFVLSPQAFRCLTAENRKAFKKYTPPVTYHMSAN